MRKFGVVVALLIGLLLVGSAKMPVVVDGLGEIGPLNPLPVYTAAGPYEFGMYSAVAPVAAQAAESADTCVFAMLNPASPGSRDVYVTQLIIEGAFMDAGSAHVSLAALELARFTVAVPAGGTSITVAKLSDSAQSASAVTNVRHLSTGLTMTSAAYGGSIARATINNGAATHSSLVLDLAGAPVQLKPGEGLAARLAGTTRSEDQWSITVIWGESGE